MHSRNTRFTRKTPENVMSVRRRFRIFLKKEGFEALIGRMDTDLPYIVTSNGVYISRSLGSSKAYHEFVRVGDYVFDGLTGPQGMHWNDYVKLFYDDVFTDGTIRVTYRP